ncbi:MAG: hypothetical protein AB7E76_08400 [Deferribacterales bacterium]
MKKLMFVMIIATLFTSSAFAGEKSEKAGEAFGKAARETKEAGELLIDGTKKGAKKAGEYIKELYEDTKEGAKDFNKGMKKGYKEEEKKDGYF